VENARNIIAFYCNDGTTWYEDGGESGAGSVVMDMIVDANGIGLLLLIARWYDSKKEGNGRINTIKTVTSRVL
jgi:hypothetical protein